MRKLFRQRKMGNAWGYFMQIVQQEAIPIQSVILVLSLVTTASVLQIRGYEIPIWALALVIAVVLAIGGVAIFTVGMPSYFSAFNDQFWKHNNPLRRKMEAIEENQRKIMKHLGMEVEHEDSTPRDKHTRRKTAIG